MSNEPLFSVRIGLRTIEGWLSRDASGWSFVIEDFQGWRRSIPVSPANTIQDLITVFDTVTKDYPGVPVHLRKGVGP